MLDADTCLMNQMGSFSAGATPYRLSDERAWMYYVAAEQRLACSFELEGRRHSTSNHTQNSSHIRRRASTFHCRNGRFLCQQSGAAKAQCRFNE